MKHTGTYNLPAHFEAVFRYTNAGIIITDEKRKIITINPHAVKEFGYSKAALIGKEIDILIPCILKQKVFLPTGKITGRQAKARREDAISVMARKKNGREFPVEVSQVDYIKNGQKFVLFFVSNISARKKAEAEIEKLNDSLEATVEKRTCDLQNTLYHLGNVNARLQEAILFQNAILENAGAIIITCDINGIIQTFNREAEKELGYSAGELIGKKGLLIFHLPQEIERYAKELSEELNREISTDLEVLFVKATLGLHNEREWTYRTKYGDTIPVLLNFTSLRDAGNRLIGFLGIGINITERKKNEQNLTEALKKEKELGELKTRFVSIASHEFRTPLTAILSSIFLIEKYNTSADQVKREVHLSRIMEAVNMLTDILNDFLSVSKIEEGKIQVRPVHLKLGDLMAKLIDELNVTLKPRQRIQYRHTGDEEVVLDESLFKHIIINLISNASKFSDENGKIAVRTVNLHEKLTLYVSDNGIGIPAEDQKHLMERFFRGTNAGNIQGTGLGLHIISKYAELMNGIVKINSKPGKGTTVKIVFNCQRMARLKDVRTALTN